MQVRHASAPSRQGPEDRKAERGETLVEVLVMIVLMGVGFAAIFSGLMTVSRINHANRKATQASNAVQAWTEGLQQPATRLTGSNSDPYTYLDCATAATYGRQGQASGMMPTDWSNQAMNQAPVKVEYLSGYDGNGEPVWFSNVNTCYANGDKGLQKITLKIETPPGDFPRVVDTLVFIKRNQRCPDVAGFDNADLGPC